METLGDFAFIHYTGDMNEAQITAAHILNMWNEIYCPVSQVSVAPLNRNGVTACACCGTVLNG